MPGWGSATAVGIAVGVDVGVAVGVGAAVGVAVGAAVGVGVAVGLGENVGGGVGVPLASRSASGPDPAPAGDPRPCGEGVTCTNQSKALSLESVPLPADAPGRRSRLDPAGGAGAALPSTNAFVASPHPTASIAAPPTMRSATAPPVAAKPPEYVASARTANVPAALAMRIRLPGSRIVDPVHVALRVTVEPVEVA